ncbi:shikimate kinase AroL [Desulfothermus okinawensis JCM 13304]
MRGFIKKEFALEEPDLKAVYKIGGAKRGWKFDPKSHNIFFIGPRASGKTTLGKVVAKELNMDFWDTDEEIVKQIGMDIGSFVKKYSWEKFREIESQVLKNLTYRKAFVCATGGGIVLKEENRNFIKEKGFVFYLMGDVLTFEKRILSNKDNKNRPPLTDLSLREELVATLREREPLYLSIAHFILRADKDIEDLKKDVLTFLGV